MSRPAGLASRSKPSHFFHPWVRVQMSDRSLRASAWCPWHSRLVTPRTWRALKLPTHSPLPMVFQYNPLDYVIETNQGGELVISVCRPGTAAPKIRYNLHHVGRVVRFRQVERALTRLGVRPTDLAERNLDFPVLFHYGRSDSTVASYGSNVAPSDLHEVVYSLPELADRVRSFALRLGEDEDANKTLTFAFELAIGAEPPANVEATRAGFLRRLAEVNQDYREAARFIPPGNEPTLELYALGEGREAAGVGP